MTIAELIRGMAAAGAPPEAIALAVEAIEAKDAALEARRASDRERKRRQRSGQSRDSHVTVTGQSEDKSTHARAEYNTTRAHAVIPVGISNDIPPIINPLLVPPSPETAPRKASRAKPKTQIDEKQRPTDADCKHAQSAGLSAAELATEWRRFRDYHRAKGSLMADWSAAWRTWVGNRDRFAQPRAGPPRERGGFATMLMQSIEAINGRENASNPENLPALSFDYGTAGSGKTGDDGGLSGRLPRPDG